LTPHNLPPPRAPTPAILQNRWWATRFSRTFTLSVLPPRGWPGAPDMPRSGGPIRPDPAEAFPCAPVDTDEASVPAEQVVGDVLEVDPHGLVGLRRVTVGESRDDCRVLVVVAAAPLRCRGAALEAAPDR
jgi:hypothetical protein